MGNQTTASWGHLGNIKRWLVANIVWRQPDDLCVVAWIQVQQCAITPPDIRDLLYCYHWAWVWFANISNVPSHTRAPFVVILKPNPQILVFWHPGVANSSNDFEQFVDGENRSCKNWLLIETGRYGAISGLLAGLLDCWLDCWMGWIGYLRVGWGTEHLKTFNWMIILYPHASWLVFFCTDCLASGFSIFGSASLAVNLVFPPALLPRLVSPSEYFYPPFSRKILKYFYPHLFLDLEKLLCS